MKRARWATRRNDSLNPMGVGELVSERDKRGQEKEESISKRVVDFLTVLSLATRSRCLYPPDHPTVRDSLLSLMDLASRISEVSPKIDLELRPDGFFLQGKRLAPEREGVLRLCQKLRSMNVKVIALNFDFSYEDIGALVELLSMDAMSVLAQGGAQDFLTGKGVEAFCLLEGGLIHGKGVDDTAGFYGLSGFSGQGPVIPKEESEGLKVKVKPELDIFDLGLLESPEMVAEAIRKAWDDDAKDHESQVSKILGFIDAMITAFSGQEDLRSLLRHLGEALLFLESDIRDHLLSRLLESGCEVYRWFPVMISTFTERELIDLLAGMLFNMRELTEKARDFILESFSQDKARALLIGLREKLIDMGATPDLAARLSCFGPNEMPPDREDLLRVMCNTQGRVMDSLGKSPNCQDLWQTALDEFPPLLLSLLERGEMVENLELAANWTRQVLFYLAEDGEYERTSKLVTRIQEIIHLGFLPPKVEEILRNTLKELGEAGFLRTMVVNSFYRSDDKVDEAGRLAGLLLVLGEDSLRELVEILAEEERVGFRKFICEVLVVAGAYNVHLLGSFVMDERWYLARNMVYILGRIGSPNSVVYLKMATKHAHHKVRCEAINALGLIGNGEAVEELAKALKHDDPAVRVLASRWLGKIGGDFAESALLGIVEKGLGNHQDLRLLEEAMSALIDAGCRRVYPLLLDMAKRKRYLGKRKWERIVALAREGLRRMESEHPDLVGGGHGD